MPPISADCVGRWGTGGQRIEEAHLGLRLAGGRGMVKINLDKLCQAGKGIIVCGSQPEANHWPSPIGPEFSHLIIGTVIHMTPT